jgi:prophage DNA circulation protein
MRTYDAMTQIPRHVALSNTSVDDARSSLRHYTDADLETVKQAIKLELAKGPDARATMVRLLKDTIGRLEKQALKASDEVANESA